MRPPSQARPGRDGDRGGDAQAPERPQLQHEEAPGQRGGQRQAQRGEQAGFREQGGAVAHREALKQERQVG